MASAAGVNINVESKNVRVDHLDKNLHAETTLPFPVDGDAGSATFDTDTSLLVLTLPVLAPPEEEKQFLDVTEAPPNNDAQDESVAENTDTVKEEHVMVQAQKLRGMAMPHKLGSNVMF